MIALLAANAIGIVAVLVAAITIGAACTIYVAITSAIRELKQ
jgi:hypothetical protein